MDLPSILIIFLSGWNDQNLEKAEEMLIKAVEESNYQDGAILIVLAGYILKKN